TGVCGQSAGSVGAREWCAVAVHHTGKAGGELLHRELQRTSAGRMLERELVCESVPSASQDRGMEEGLQPSTAAQRSGLPHARGESFAASLVWTIANLNGTMRADPGFSLIEKIAGSGLTLTFLTFSSRRTDSSARFSHRKIGLKPLETTLKPFPERRKCDAR